MATHQVDTVGLRCPQPVLKINEAAQGLPPGEMLEVTGDCDTFEGDIRSWCQRMSKTLLSVNRDGKLVTALLQL